MARSPAASGSALPATSLSCATTVAGWALDPYTGEFTEDTRQRDLEAVVTAVGVPDVTLLGISEEDGRRRPTPSNIPAA